MRWFDIIFLYILNHCHYKMPYQYHHIQSTVFLSLSPSSLFANVFAVIDDQRSLSLVFSFTSFHITNFACIFFFVSINSIITVWCFSNHQEWKLCNAKKKEIKIQTHWKLLQSKLLNKIQNILTECSRYIQHKHTVCVLCIRK